MIPSQEVLLYYHFTEIQDPKGFAARHLADCQELGLVGRILVAREGLNGSVSGTPAACARYRNLLLADPRFNGIEFKVETSDLPAFKKLFVRVRDEIITLGQPIAVPVHQRTGKHLSPAEWQAMMDDPDVVLIDGRNDYESALGHFEGALCPQLESFRDFPAWLLDHRDEWRGKKLLTYCTGGIRCEKLSAWMLEVGFEEVYQLHGGVVNYGHDPETDGEGWLGVNVVFDERITAPVGTKSAPLTVCRECGVHTINYVNCANVACNARIVVCPACEEATGRCCSAECRQAPLKREKGAKLHAGSG